MPILSLDDDGELYCTRCGERFISHMLAMAHDCRSLFDDLAGAALFVIWLVRLVA